MVPRARCRGDLHPSQAGETEGGHGRGILTEKKPGTASDAWRRAEEAREADLGPVGSELRRFLDEFAGEHDGDPIVAAAVPHLAVLAQYYNRDLARVERIPRRAELATLRRDRRRATADDPGSPSAYHQADGVLFEVDGTNHMRSLGPVMEALGEPTRAPASIRAPRWRRAAAERSALRLAGEFLRSARARGVRMAPPLLHSTHGVFVIAAQLGAHTRALIKALSPSAVVVAATPNVGPRALIGAARSLRTPSVYIPHAPVLWDPTFNDLPVDYAGLRGPREVDYYEELIGASEQVVAVGNPSLESNEMPEHDPSLPAVLAPPTPEEELRAVVEMVHAGVGDEVILSPHPRADHGRLRALVPGGWEIWGGRTYELLRQGPPAVIQCRSGVSLEALMLGIPTIELRLPADRTITYPLISGPYVRIASDADALAAAVEDSRADAKRLAARRTLRDWALEWSSPVGEEAAQRAAELVRRAGAAPPPGAIWSGWPAPAPDSSQ